MVIFSSDGARVIIDQPLEWSEPGTLDNVPGVMYSFDCSEGISEQSIMELYSAGFNVLGYSPTPDTLSIRVFVPRSGVSVAIA